MKNEIRNKDVIKELNRIARNNNGILRPEIVVKEAKNPNNPLHSRFTWDDSEAAHQYRLEQARRMIRVVVDIIPNGNNEEESVWVSLKNDRHENGGGYRKLVSVLSDQDLREQLLEQAMEDMKYFKMKYSHLNELAEIFEAMDKVSVKV